MSRFKVGDKVTCTDREEGFEEGKVYTISEIIPSIYKNEIYFYRFEGDDGNEVDFDGKIAYAHEMTLVEDSND